MNIITSDGYTIQIDVENLHKIAGYSLYISFDENSRLPYVMFNGGLLHRFITDAPVGVTVDHINGDTFDNRKVNLRLVHNRFNSQNTYLRREGKTSSKYLGVHVNKLSRLQPYRVRSYKEKKQVSLGSYPCEHEAALVYNMFQLENFNLHSLGGLNLLGETTTHLI